MIEIMGLVYEKEKKHVSRNQEQKRINLFIIYPEICINSKNKWKNSGYAFTV